VTNGVYGLTTGLTISHAVNLSSFGGPGSVTITRDPSLGTTGSNGRTLLTMSAANAANAVADGFLFTNSATIDSGVPTVSMSRGTLRNCVLTLNNTSNGTAHGVDLTGGLVENCVFSNTTQRLGYAVRITSGTPAVRNCLFENLVTTGASHGGAGVYIFGWLGTYGTILAPLAAIFITDYYFVKKRNLDVMALFQGPEGRYWYQSGWNVRAIIAWVAAFALPILDQMNGVFGGWVIANGYIISFAIGMLVYYLLMQNEKTSFFTQEEHDELTEHAG